MNEPYSVLAAIVVHGLVFHLSGKFLERVGLGFHLLVEALAFVPDGIVDFLNFR